MSLRLCALASVAVASLFGAQAAQAEGYGYCYARLNGNELITPVFAWIGDGKREVVSKWEWYLRDNWRMTDGNLRDCSWSRSEAEARQYQSSNQKSSKAQVVDFAPAAKPNKSAGSRKAPSKAATKTATATAKAPATAAQEVKDTRAAEKAAREAEWLAKVAAHEAEVAEHQRKVKAREAEIARQQREHAAAQEKARQAQQAHAAKMTMFERVLEEQRQRQREYEAAEARHRRCVNGDQQACADIKAGKPALEGAQEAELAAKEEPKTSDDDARTCVTEPVVSASKTWKGAMQAVAYNGCKTAVDVRICLLRTGGWNCGMVNALKPQDRWTWWSYETKGGIFWDARMAGSNEPLASPGSN